MSNSLWSPYTTAYQAPLSMDFSRQEYWSELSSPGDLPNTEIKHVSHRSAALAGGFFTAEPPEKPIFHTEYLSIYVFTPTWIFYGKIINRVGKGTQFNSSSIFLSKIWELLIRYWTDYIFHFLDLGKCEKTIYRAFPSVNLSDSIYA